MKLLRTVEENEAVPAWYAAAWFDPYRRVAYVLPLPLALPVALARAAWAGLRTASRDMAADPRTAYLDGFEEGFRYARTHPPKPGWAFHVRAWNRARWILEAPKHRAPFP